MPEGHIQLKWTSYQEDMRALFIRLRESEDLSDVVLTNGMKSIKCHRLILSSASQNFHELLKNHTGHVVIYLGSVPTADMTSLVDFMYSGEAEVAQSRLSEFFSLARQWSVRGLADGRAETDVQAPEPAAGPEPPARGSPCPRKEPTAAADTGGAGRTISAAERTLSSREESAQRHASDGSSSDEDGAGPSGINSAVLSILKPSSSNHSKNRRARATPASASYSSVRAGKSSKKVAKMKVMSKGALTLENLPDMYACPHCPRVFIKPTFFKRHKANEHGDTSPLERHLVVMAHGGGGGGGGGAPADRAMLSVKLPTVRKKRKKRDQEAAAAVAATEAAVAVATAEAAASASAEAALSKRRSVEITPVRADTTTSRPPPPAPAPSAVPAPASAPAPAAAAAAVAEKAWDRPTRRDSSVPQASPARSTRIVFDQEGRARPAAPVAAPAQDDCKPICVVTHVSSASAGDHAARHDRDKQHRDDRAERHDQDLQHRDERGWRRDCWDSAGDGRQRGSHSLSPNGTKRRRLAADGGGRQRFAEVRGRSPGRAADGGHIFLDRQGSATHSHGGGGGGGGSGLRGGFDHTVGTGRGYVSLGPTSISARGGYGRGGRGAFRDGGAASQRRLWVRKDLQGKAEHFYR